MCLSFDTSPCLVAIVIYKLKASRLSLRYCTNTKTVFQMKHL